MAISMESGGEGAQRQLHDSKKIEITREPNHRRLASESGVYSRQQLDLASSFPQANPQGSRRRRLDCTPTQRMAFARVSSTTSAVA